MPPHPPRSSDEQAIDAVVGAFFRLFSNQGGVSPNLRAIFELCLPEAIICRCLASPPEVTSLEAFIAPRQRLLSDGTLTDFSEAEVDHQTHVLGNIAQRWCTYRKSGLLAGEPFSARGVKVFQLVRCPDGWRICAVSWDDERSGFSLDSIAPGT